MKLFNLFVAVLVCVAHAFAADALTEKLQRGLFEEEANHNLDAAIKQYQSVVAQSDEQRKVVAMALFRLAESYRKLGRTNEANAQYQRILRDFSEQEALGKLATDLLKPLLVAGNKSALTQELEHKITALRVESIMQQMEADRLASLSPADLLNSDAVRNDAVFNELRQKGLAEGEKLETLKQGLPLADPAVQSSQAQVKEIRQLIEERMKAIVAGVQQRAKLMTMQLKALGEELKNAEAGLREPNTAGPSWKTISDPEQVRLLQEEIKLAEQQVAAVERSHANGTAPLASVLNAKRDVLAVRRLLPENSSLSRQKALLEEQVKIVEQLLNEANERVKVGVVSPTEVIPLQRELLTLQREVAGLTDGSAASATPGPAQSGMTQAEAEELTRVKTLAKNSPDLLQSSGKDGLSQLQLAARDGYYSVVEFILAQGVNANGPERGSPPLMLAAQRGHLRIVQLLLDKGANVNAANTSGQTALMSACENGFRSVVELLLARGADVNRITNGDATALHFAVWKGHAGLVELLLQRGANPNVLSRRPSPNYTWSSANVNGATPLHLTVDGGFIALAELLLKSGASASATNYARVTPLHLAVAAGNTNLCTLLLDKGASPNVQAQDDYTPLVRAIEAGRPEVVSLLLAKGADVNRAATNFNRYFYSPIHIAVGKNIEVLDAVLAAKPNLEVINGDGWTPLISALISAEVSGDKVDRLLAAGADPNREAKGVVPVLSATQKGNLRSVTALLEHGANPNVIDKSGETPLSVAQNILKGAQRTARDYADWEQIERTLREHGANENLRRLRAITFTRPTWTAEDSKIFFRGTNDYNRHTLFELLANVFSGQNAPAFPDLAHVTLERIEGTNAKSRELNLNIDEMVRSGQCSNDLQLEWGDRISIPELDHPLNESWPGLSPEMREMLTRCLTRRVQVIVKQETNVVKLVQNVTAGSPRFPGAFGGVMVSPPPIPVQSGVPGVEARTIRTQPIVGQQGSGVPTLPASPAAPQEKTEKVLPTFRLKEVVYGANVLRASSDPTRVRVVRREPTQTNEWVIDLTKVATNGEWNAPGSNQQTKLWPSHDLWLRDGDVIEIPDKQ